MASDGDSRYAPPASKVADVAGTQAAELATRWSRLFAAVLDSVVLMALGTLLGLVLTAAGFGSALKAFAPGPGRNPFAPGPVAGLVGLAMFMVVNGWLLMDRGQTVGKAMLGVRIVRRDGSKASALRVLGLRYGLSSALNMVPMVGGLYALVDCLLIFRQSRRCLHDEIADTIVVRA
jgi:uncharacterized RDD family membrane protein YckC